MNYLYTQNNPLLSHKLQVIIYALPTDQMTHLGCFPTSYFQYKCRRPPSPHTGRSCSMPHPTATCLASTHKRWMASCWWREVVFIVTPYGQTKLIPLLSGLQFLRLCLNEHACFFKRLALSLWSFSGIWVRLSFHSLCIESLICDTMYGKQMIFFIYFLEDFYLVFSIYFNNNFVVLGFLL